MVNIQILCLHLEEVQIRNYLAKIRNKDDTINIDWSGVATCANFFTASMTSVMIINIYIHMCLSITDSTQLSASS